ncbi:DUF3052 domain-containing protein [Leifsonia sp. ZF2019]|uniref:DUF3052 domain-containing protein n=1 Tax=Leifsonia sp. ZF2019 TaxID=2781978 RepID=UPI001CBE1E7A|nr:DUF3052 domain-containing protein [Leifsonia sp. ZF2019]UAJ79142.1 DUF3052 domain-containing protein [Leifsonia sp. ZF2019]
MSTPAGYSGTPLWKKLGLKPGMRAQLLHADAGWRIPLDAPDAPAPIEWLPPRDDGPAGLVLAFYREAAEYLAELDALGARIRPAGMLWAAWPRKAAGHVSDIDENLLRDAALDRGLVDVKVAALSTDWSGLKIVWRRENR